MHDLVRELSAHVGIRAACQVLEVPRSWYYRQQVSEDAAEAPQPRQSAQRPPAHALREAEKAEGRTVLNSERFCDQAPREGYATLLDEGHYRCHWRTMSRILAAHQEVGERRNLRRHPAYQRPQLQARGPNQVWSWDITLLRGPQPGGFYYLYLILDIYSRYVVGVRRR